MKSKREAQLSGDMLAFVDRSEFEGAVKDMVVDFEKRLKQQQMKATGSLIKSEQNEGL